MRAFHQNKTAIYPFEDWAITETEFRPEHHHRSETVFSLGNGYMGLRGNFEESCPSGVPSTPGTYINGFYETEPIIYGEFAPAQPKEYQTMINVTAWIPVEVWLDGERFAMDQGTVHRYRRSLDMYRGVLSRHLVWENSRGSQVEIHFQRFVSQTNQHLGVLRCTVTPLTDAQSLKLISKVDGAVTNHYHLRHTPLSVQSTEMDNNTGWLHSRTQNTQFSLLCGCTHDLHSTAAEPPPLQVASHAANEYLHWEVEWSPRRHVPLTMDKYAVLGTERDMGPDELKPVLEQVLHTAAATGYEPLLEEHARCWADYWQDTDVQIQGDPQLQQGFRFNAFHLFQSAGRSGQTNVAAKGLTGEYYEGHYFWDTETYIIPFFLYSQPGLVKKLLTYRYQVLDQARDNARRMRSRGALYAWRTIDGREASGNFLGSTVQYHINADIAYAIHKYMEATEDMQFLEDYGAEILFETARCWADRGFFSPRHNGQYCINEVCGPDEYKPGVNNNCYTNYMAKFNLELAVKAHETLRRQKPEVLHSLSQKIELDRTEIDQWQRCADNMYLPYDEELGIHPQDDSFLYKDPIDVDAIPEDDIPLVGNWHPLVIWRYQIIKQADVVLLQFLLSHEFTLSEKKRDFDYYEPKTTHDSSLSPAIYSIAAAEIGYHDYAANYFRQTARLDLDDYNKNAWQGVHTACMAGSWMCVVNGFAGMRTTRGRLSFKPMLPAHWEGYAFKIKFKGRQLELRVRPGTVTYSLLGGDSLEFDHNGQKATLHRSEDLHFSLK